MPRSNEISFGGILGPLVESLERNRRQSGRLVGQDVVIPGNGDVSAIIAVDSEDNIHLLISPQSNDDTHFERLDLKGLKIGNHQWSVSGRPAQNYLDISCSTGELPTFRRPFLRFAEDVLYEILKTNNTPDDAVYRTGIRWKKFWSADVAAHVSRDWLHGLFGELLFLLDVMNRFGPRVVNKWSGPVGADHDFQAGKELAVEVKTGVDNPLQIHCNIRQLDPTLFTTMYLACYKLSASENGMTLTQLVRNIEAQFAGDMDLLEIFYERLAAVGYTPQLESEYNEFPLEYSPAMLYPINDSLPKITAESFSGPVDHRISNIRYTLELSGMEGLSIEDVADHLKGFA